MLRMPIRTLVISVVLMVLAGAFILFARPAKPEMRTYRIGEQGLAGDEDETREQLARTTVASVLDYQVSALEIQQALKQLPPFRRYYYSSPEKMHIFLQNYGLLLLLANEGISRNLESRPYVRYVLEEQLARRYRQTWLAEQVKASDISDGEVRTYLAEHEAELAEQSGRDRQDRQGLEVAAKAALLEQRRNAAWATHLDELTAELERNAP